MSNRGQYLQFLERLQECLSTFLSVVRFVFVDALTSWSDRFLFLLWPNMILASLVVASYFQLYPVLVGLRGYVCLLSKSSDNSGLVCSILYRK